MQDLNTVKQLELHWPEIGTINNFHFSTETTNLKKVNHGWQKTIERKVEIIYLGRKEKYRLFQVLTIKIILKSNKAFPNKSLLTQLGYVFDYLELGINDRGLIKKVFNQKEVLLRFQDLKKQIEKDHYGLELEQLLHSLAKTIEDEEKLISFLHSYKMFGLYFTDLYVPFLSKPTEVITREIILEELEHQRVEEKIITVEQNGNFTFDVRLNAAVETIKNYQGIIATEYNRVKMGYLEIETEDSNIKHTTSWVG
jgi:hypothetical protein